MHAIEFEELSNELTFFFLVFSCFGDLDVEFKCADQGISALFPFDSH